MIAMIKFLGLEYIEEIIFRKSIIDFVNDKSDVEISENYYFWKNLLKKLPMQVDENLVIAFNL